MDNGHWTTADIPDQTGRVAIVTGANTGLGFETAKALVGANALVVLAVRNLDKQGGCRKHLSGHPPRRHRSTAPRSVLTGVDT